MDASGGVGSVVVLLEVFTVLMDAVDVRRSFLAAVMDEGAPPPAVVEWDAAESSCEGEGDKGKPSPAAPAVVEEAVEEAPPTEEAVEEERP